MREPLRRPGSNFWWIAFQSNGREKRESTKIVIDAEGVGGKSYRKAERVLTKRLGEVEARTYIGTKERKVTFAKLVELYEADYAKRELRSGAAATSRVKNLRAFFGEDQARTITPDRLTAYQVMRKDEGAEGATINRELSALHRMLVLAVKQRLLSTIPPFPERMAENEPRQGFFEHAEYQAIREHLASDDQDVLDFGYHSGWRLREITELPWSEVDLEGGVIRLSPERSKSKRGRVLPLIPPLLAVIKRREKARTYERDKEPHVSELVFHVTGEPIGDLRKRWLAVCVKAGFYITVGKKKMPTKLFHDLRRTCVRNLIRSGVDPHLAMKWTGHETDSVFRSYNIVNETDLRDAGAKLTAHVARIAQTGGPR